MNGRRHRSIFKAFLRLSVILIVVLLSSVLLQKDNKARSDESTTSLTINTPVCGTENRYLDVSSEGYDPNAVPEEDPAEGTVEGFVDHIYTSVLNRDADQDGKAYWVKTLTNGKATGADCAFSILTSAEFTGKKLSSSAFLDVVYQALCSREADASGKSYWQGELDSGRQSREDVIKTFIDSTEWCNTCAAFGVCSGAPTAKATRASGNATVFATRLYTCCLKREPELDGLRYWSLALTNLEKSGKEAAQFFFESEEFLSLGTSNKEFLTRLYTTYMGREPENSGMDYWMDQLKTGMGRQQVMGYFSTSPEFTALCKKHGLYRDPTPTPTPATTYVNLVAVGDNLYHEKIIRSGRRGDGSYNYDFIYANIKGYIQDMDVKIINQEVLLTSNSSMWSGYPNFASPLEAGQAVVNAGFNVVTHATNHSWDKGRAVALDSINFWKSQPGLLLTGMYASQADYNNLVIGEYNGIKIAFLNYTYGLNGRTLPADSRYMVKLLDMDLVCSEIRRARTQADIVIVLPHWGEEYKTFANEAQKSMARQMAEAGADLIIGCHPHVVQPLEILTTSSGKKVPCFYSLGNFVSNMTQSERCVEAMAKVRIKKENGVASVEYVEAVPLVNYINAEGTFYTVYPLDHYTDDLARSHRNSGVTPGYVRSFWNRVFSTGSYTYLGEDQ
ncbi:MAG: CapA family protein [Clostridiales bacterium]|nr:CapA family protein [Clostridiales bacterium]